MDFQRVDVRAFGAVANLLVNEIRNSRVSDLAHQALDSWNGIASRVNDVMSMSAAAASMMTGGSPSPSPRLRVFR